MTTRTRWGTIGIAAVVIAAGAALLFLTRREEAPEAPPTSVRTPGESAVGVQPKKVGPAAGTEMVQAPIAFPSFADSAANPATGPGRIFGKTILPTTAPSGFEISVSLHRVDADALVVSYDETFFATAKVVGEGAYEFVKLPIGAYALYASAPGYTAYNQVTLVRDRVSQQADLYLAPGGTIAGRVVNEAREPVAGARVFVAAWDVDGGRQFASRERSLSSQQMTDNTGAFVVNGTKKSTKGEPGYKLAVKAEGYATFLSKYIQADAPGVEFVLSEGGLVNGRLVRADTGGPVPNKTITLDSDLSMERLIAPSDAEGFFFLPSVPAGTQQASLVDDELVITSESSRFLVAEGSATNEVVLVAAPGARVSGRVVEAASGEGIGGIGLLARMPSGVGPPLRATTDSAGAYRFAGLKPGSWRITWAEKPIGYRSVGPESQNSHVVSTRIGEEISGIDFTLVRGLRISGVAVYEDGKPIGGMGISASPKDGGQIDYGFTKADGEFVLAGFQANSDVRISTHLEGLALLSVQPPDGHVKLGDADVSGLRLVLGEGCTVSGTVLDTQGRPKSGVEMYALSTNRVTTSYTSVRSGADGTFTLKGLRPGEHRVGFQDRRSDPPPPEELSVNLTKGDKRTGLRFVFPEPEGPGNLTITGRVTDVRGQAVRGAQISASRGGFRQVETDTNGQYTLTKLAPGEVALQASHPNYSQSPEIRTTAGASGVDVVLHDFATIEGRVIDVQTSQPVTAFRVRCRDASTSVRDLEGRFQLAKVQEGDALIIATAEGYSEARLAILSLTGGETRRNVVVRLDRGIELTGRVVDQSGKGIGAASITLGDIPSPESGGDVRATSTADGSFRVGALPAGTIRLSARHPNYAPAMTTVTLQPGARNEAEIVLTAGASVEGRVRVNGQPKPDARVNVRRPSGFYVSAQTDTTGYYRIERMPEGAASVVASEDRDRGRSKAVPVPLSAGYVSEVNFDFGGGSATIEGTVYASENTPVSKRVNLRAECDVGGGAVEAFSVQTDDKGSYRFEGLPASSVRIHVSTGNPPPTVLLELAEGERAHRDINLFDGATLRVEVSGVPAGPLFSTRALLLAGTFAIGAWSEKEFHLVNDHVAGSSRLTEGVAEFKNLGPGQYTVLVYSQDTSQYRPGADMFAGARWATAIVEFKDDPSVTVRLDL